MHIFQVTASLRCVKLTPYAIPAGGQRAARGALPDRAGQSIILKDRGRRFPTARSAHSASPPSYSQVARAPTRVWTLNYIVIVIPIEKTFAAVVYFGRMDLVVYVKCLLT